jgi:hypothetical protein
MDFYNYWVEMHSYLDNPMAAAAFGNTLTHYLRLQQDVVRWDSYEIHLKLNPNPEVGTGAVLEL